MYEYEFRGDINGRIMIPTPIGEVDLLKIKQDISVKDFGAVGDGLVNDTESFLKCINYAYEKGISKINVPKSSYVLNLLELQNIEGLEIDFNNSILLSDGTESRMLELKNCENITLKKFHIDGKNSYFRGIRVWENNKNIKISDFTIKNISPLIRENPTMINSFGIDLYVNLNENILIENFTIEDIKNNNNSVLGDVIGTSRGIVVQDHDTQLDHKNIVFRNFSIKNVLSEDGEGIHVYSSFSAKTYNVLFEKFTIDNCFRRSIKIQSVHGLKFKDFNLIHSDRTFYMASVISDLSMFNTFEKFNIDCYTVKGLEIMPFDNIKKDKISIVKDFNIVLTNDELLGGARTFPIDILSISNFTVTNVIIKDGLTKSRNPGVILRTYTKNVLIENLKTNHYVSNQFSINGEFIPIGGTPNIDGQLISHDGLHITNIKSEYYPLYLGSSTTIVVNSLFRNNLSEDLTINLNAQFYFKQQTIQTLPRIFTLNSIPTTGTWLRNDIVFRSSPVAGGYIGWVCLSSGTPGTWKGFGLVEA